MTSLFADLDKSGFHSSIMTTYSVDPTFYDGSIQRRLRAKGCENNILIADADMLERALTATPEAFADAGRRYALEPAHPEGCFHPKVLLRLGKRKARATIGSANATAAGWGVNRELVGMFDTAAVPPEGVSDFRPLVRKLYDYLASFLDVPGDAIDYKLNLHVREAPWFFEVEAARTPLVLPDGSAVDLLCERGDRGEPGMMRRVLDLIGTDSVRRLTIVSPYWDSDLAALRELVTALPDADVTIGLSTPGGTFPKERYLAEGLGDENRIRFADLSQTKGGGRFLHAKLFVLEADAADHVLYGSANCSDDALGRQRLPARNAEVDIYRRLAAGRFFSWFPIDLSQQLDLTTIDEPKTDTPSTGWRSTQVRGGTVEIENGALLWHPSRDALPFARAARLLIGDTEVVPLALGNNRFRAKSTSPIEAPVIVRAAFADGRVSTAMIAHDAKRLRASSPGSTSLRLHRAIESIKTGEHDFIMLAHHIQELFGQHAGAGQRRVHSRKSKQTEQSAPSNFSSPQEMRDALLVRPASDGRSGRTLTDQSSLREFFRILANGLDLKKEMDAEDEAEQEALGDGDTQDGEDDFDALENGTGTGAASNDPLCDDESVDDGGLNDYTASDEKTHAATNGTSKAGQSAKRTKPRVRGISSDEAMEHGRIWDLSEIKALRRGLDIGIAAVERDLSIIRTLPPAPDDGPSQTEGADARVDVGRIPAQVAFLLCLLLEAAFKPLTTARGKILLLEPVAFGGGDRERTLAVRAGRILQSLFSHEARAIARVPLDQHRSLPDDVFELLIVSRFSIEAILRCCKGSLLEAKLAPVALDVEAALDDYGPLDPVAVAERMASLDAMIGPGAIDAFVAGTRTETSPATSQSKTAVSKKRTRVS